MILLTLAEGFEEIEALTPVDMLRRAGQTVKTVGVTGKVVTGAHGIPVTADLCPEDVRAEEVTLLILPGGMPGTKHLDESAFVDGWIRQVATSGGRLAAICAAPVVLGKRGYLKGRHAVCYPGFESYLAGAVVEDSPVVTDGTITTARGMGVAFAFARELVRLTAGDEVADRVALSTMPDGLPVPAKVF